MKVQFIGSQDDPDHITMYGFNFERKGDPVEIPDDHRHAEKFVNNQHFKVQKAPKGLAAPDQKTAPEPVAPATPATPADFEDDKPSQTDPSVHPTAHAHDTHAKAKPGPKSKA